MYGKFANADELYKSYNEPEKAFTQKCQQLAAMQQQKATAEGTSQQPPAVTVGTETSEQVATIPQENSCSNADRQPISQEEVKQYLQDNISVVMQLLKPQQLAATPQVMTSGGTVQLTVPSRPRTIKEAGELARKYVSKQNS